MDADHTRSSRFKSCCDAYDYGLSKVGPCSEKAREMILAEVIKFTNRELTSECDDPEIEQIQYECLSRVKIDGIHAADARARSHPRCSEWIFNEVERLLELTFPTSEAELEAQFQVLSDVRSKVAEICSSDR
jgi:hypothetical protein